MTDQRSEAIKVAIVDDQPLFSAGLAMLIEAQSDMDCVGTALEGTQAVRLAAQSHPDVILMDLRMPVMNGLIATQKILDSDSPTPPRVIVLTTLRKDEAIFHALKAGASAFLTKDVAPTDLLAAIRSTHYGQEVAATSLDIVQQFAHPDARHRPKGGIDALTARERDVFMLIARGLSNAEIAEQLFLSEATVKSHTRSVLKRLDLRSRIQVVIFGYENGLIDTAPRSGV